MNNNFAQIQEEMKAWQAHNFPGRESWMPLMGLGEELGELMASSKSEDIKDAIGDCCIYIADYCNAMNYDMQAIFNMSANSRTYGFVDVFIAYSKICHAHLKMIQKIRMHEDHVGNSIQALSKILFYLNSFTYETVEEIAWSIWLKVRVRDWQKNRNTAHEESHE